MQRGSGSHAEDFEENGTGVAATRVDGQRSGHGVAGLIDVDTFGTGKAEAAACGLVGSAAEGVRCAVEEKFACGSVAAASETESEKGGTGNRGLADETAGSGELFLRMEDVS